MPSGNKQSLDEYCRSGSQSKTLAPTRMMVTKLANPRPIILGEPNAAGRGAAILGHRAKKPSGEPWQLEPPPQLRTPDLPIRLVPIRLGMRTSRSPVRTVAKHEQT